MIVKPESDYRWQRNEFESSVNSYDSQTLQEDWDLHKPFESSVNSYDSQTVIILVVH